jgi:nicotinate-nucleotide pyrophosphorylase (carboxylating)
MEIEKLKDFIIRSLEEDIGDGDHSTLACIPADAVGGARLIVKEDGVIAGVDIAKHVYVVADPSLVMDIKIADGSSVSEGDIVFTVAGNQQSILKTERLILNIMQRMSGIATSTNTYVNNLKGLKTKILDTRKTTPGFRYFEKEAVRLGGGINHRVGLYDMIIIKDNHIDFAGGIRTAIEKANAYLREHNKILKIEIEARDLQEIEEILAVGGVDRIMLDNFSLDETRRAIKLINGRFETESSGGITLSSIRAYAKCGVDYISVGALTHQIRSLDLSLKAL